MASDSRHRLARLWSRRSSTPSAASPIVPVTTTWSPGLAVERRTILPCGTAPKAAIETDDRPGRAVGVAAEQRTAVALRVLAKTAGKSSEPGFVDCRRQREREQKADRGCAFGGEIGQIHPQRLAADVFRPVVGKEMHAGNDAVGREHDVASGRRRHDGGVIDQAEARRDAWPAGGNSARSDGLRRILESLASRDATLPQLAILLFVRR